MDDIYKGKTKEETIELVYCLTKQNLSGRETHDEIFMKGIEFCYKELCEGYTLPSTESKCNKHSVIKSVCDNKYADRPIYQFLLAFKRFWRL